MLKLIKSSTLKKKLHYSIFFFGVLVFLFYKAGFIIHSTAKRSQPVEVDDSYVYMWKAVTMANCFQNDCPAQNDLRQQVFVPAVDKETELLRIRNIRELFVVMTPLHSMILCFLHKIGWDWINAYRIVVIAGVFFICGALAYWMFITWGPLAAGVSLIFMSPMIFKSHGLHVIVPTNIALGIGALMWGRISQAGRQSWIALPLCGLSAVMMHPIGIIYTALALGLYVVMVGSKISRKNVICVSLTLGILLLAFLLPHFIERPLMNYNSPTTFQDTWIEGVKGNINNVFGSFGGKEYIDNIKIIGIGLVGFLLSLKLLEKKYHRMIITTGILLGLLSVISFFHVLPFYPSVLFYRIWIPVLSFFLAAIAYFLCSAVDVIPKLKKRTAQLMNKNQISTNPSFFQITWKKIISITLGLAIMGGLVWKIIGSTPEFKITLEQRVKRHPFTLDIRQPAELLKHAKSEDKVLYTAEIPLLFNLVNGTHKLGAVYYPAIRDSSIEQYWMGKIDYIVGWNKPIQILTQEGQKYPPVLRFSDINTIIYESAEFEDLSKLEIMISNPGQAFDINLILNSDISDGISMSTFQFHVPEGYEGWFSLNPKPQDILINRLQLIPRNGNEKAKLTGFRFSNGSGLTLWPWSQQARITVNYKDNKTISTRFDVLDTIGSKELQSYFKNHRESLQVIFDMGSTITVKKNKIKKGY